METIYTYNSNNDGAVLAVFTDGKFYYVVDLQANERWSGSYDNYADADAVAAQYMDNTYGSDNWTY